MKKMVAVVAKAEGWFVDTLSKEELTEKLISRLDRGVVHFIFEKSGGVEREAIGTRNREYIPNTRLTEDVVKELAEATDNLISNMLKCVEMPDLLKEDPDAFQYGIEIIKQARKDAFGDPDAVSKPYNPNEEYINYYDFESKGWRKFKKDQILMVL